MEFILMLTREDLTVPEARSVYAQLRDTGVRHIGCKDVGVPPDEVRALLDEIRAQGHHSHLEVVSSTQEAVLQSARVAAEVGPDHLIGGTQIAPIQAILSGTATQFFPYVGQIVGHPCLLRGTIAEICDDVRRVDAAGVAGINLLAYRYDGDVPALVEAVVGATDLPVICAGSISSEAQIRLLRELGVWGFTIGTAILDRSLLPGAALADQIEAALAAAAG
jgi:hypothetical protein